jgi:hypothetical protein
MAELFTEISFENHGNVMKVSCPDEDNDMRISIKDECYTSYCMTLDEAERLMKFLKAHIKEAKKHV